MPSGQQAARSGARILIVEDEFLIALHIQEVMEGLGFVVVGPVARLEEALEVVAGGGGIDGAVLDVNLSGTYVFPLAERLAVLGIPFILTTGYEAFTVPEELRAHPRLQKPVRETELIRLVQQTFGGDRRAAASAG
ncbi:response regulator [Rhodospirillum centenum]|uniref:CheY3 n=2 Tax=Rhodospirillum centenum TaxID=34018 RepID=B6ITY4_RHOCS|nr:response regulator [Rhodospirillum centenum]AAP22920.1 CheY3 [Rhodospirillum centenum]ACI99520.1 cheY3 [Rhodospirillum centenum SW]